MSAIASRSLVSVAPAGGGAIAQLLASGGARSVYQPIVTLPGREVVAYEALARGPAGSPLETPGALFSAAAAEGLVGALDMSCRIAAMRGALEGALRPPTALFVNVEPDVLDATVPAADMPLLRRAEQDLTLIAEITERRLAARPAPLLRAVAALRRRGWGFALDDVGADWRSVALMPFLRPDVVKLDMRLVQEPYSPESAAVVRAVRSYADASGAVVLAEGIETEEHEARAISWGATLGQGWLFGRPRALPAVPAPAVRGAGAVIADTAEADARTPARIAEQAGVRFGVAPKGGLLAHSIAIEQRAFADLDPLVVFGCFQSAAHFTPDTGSRYERLAHRAAFVGAFGVGLGPAPALGVRGADLAMDEDLAGEWNVIVVGPHHGAALIARDLGDDGPDHERRFAYVLVEDRELVLRAARSLMLRIGAGA
jgi:EAL domain-containing protein (putative c-di-GMP-specific phosphodiesterase class I)